MIPFQNVTNKRPLLRQSKLELNQGLLQRLRNPSQQVQFYEAIQQSMQRPDKTPPKLLSSDTSINPGKLGLFFGMIQKIPNSRVAIAPPPGGTPKAQVLTDLIVVFSRMSFGPFAVLFCTNLLIASVLVTVLILKHARSDRVRRLL